MDVYAFGMVLWAIEAGHEPWLDMNNRFKVISEVVQGGRPEMPRGTSDEMRALIQLCWAQQPEDRPTFTEIVNTLSEQQE